MYRRVGRLEGSGARPMSHGSVTGRTSISTSPAAAAKRDAHATASSSDAVRTIAKPAGSSLDGVNGPGVSDRRPPVNWRRTP
jgi:hypothetical protein